MKFKNPILRGFHPDPCLCKKGDVYYLATSTFEYSPGVKIFSSEDLQNWTHIASPLDDAIANLSEVPSSGGIWAPDLSYKASEDMFYLTYTITTYFEKYSPYQGFKDTHNYIIKAKDVTGPWSSPVYVGSKGFDPSLFHDEDGRSYFMCMRWNYRARSNNFDGIILQEFDTKTNELVGDEKVISKGTELKVTEGPHIYRVGDYYYLFLAEGGTSYNHSVTVLRSKNVFGPYERHPDVPFLSQVIDRNGVSKKIKNPLTHCRKGLQKVGHGSIANIEGAQYLMAFLCSRPDAESACCPLGRETALTTITFKADGWPYLDDDTESNLIPSAPSEYSFFDDFDSEKSLKDWDYLRRNFLMSQKTIIKDSCLYIEGGESPASIHQHFIGFPVSEYKWEAKTKLIFMPNDYQQMAGIVLRYNEHNQYYLAISKDEEGNMVLIVVSIIAKSYDIIAEEKIFSSEIFLKLSSDGKEIYYFYSYDDEDWMQLNASSSFLLLSDDAIKPIGFTGSFCGLMANDMSGSRKAAAFDFFSFKTLKD